MRKNPGRRERRNNEKKLGKKGDNNRKSKHIMKTKMGIREKM